MESRDRIRYIVLAAPIAAFVMVSTLAAAQTSPPAPIMPPSLPSTHTVNLMTTEGSAAFGAQWKIMEAKLVEGPAVPNAMPQYKTTYNLSPRAHDAGFDDSSWSMLPAKDLGARLGGGNVSFMWYHATLTIPEKVGAFETNGAQAVLHVLVDDYAEVWVNGQMPRRSGYPSPAAIAGLNMPNRVVLSTAVKPGDKFQLAIFGINGPISVSPANFIWFREAKVDFYK